MPQPSYDELKQTLARFQTRTGHTIVVLIVPSLDGEDMEKFGAKNFKALPLSESEREKFALLIFARKERKVGLHAGTDLRSLFPEPEASQKLQGQVDLYINGWRPDLGIHGAVSYMSKVIQGEIRFDRLTEEERFESESLQGRGAGAIFAILLAPYLAFVIGLLWGIYATQYQVHTGTRLFIGAVLGGGTAKVVASLMAAMGTYSEGLWYFILTVSIPLGIFGSLTEYWMAGEWSGIPRVKGRRLRQKPTDKMGI
jgi:uncharacterized membrane protein YgcG